MNWLELIFFLIMALSAFIGYRRGLLRMAYSLVAWLLVLAFVTWATPYFAGYLEENTPVKGWIQEKCLDYMEKAARDAGTADASGQIPWNFNSSGEGAVWLPEDILAGITGGAAEAVGEILEGSGLLGQIAESVAGFIIEGIAFFAVLAISGISARCLGHLLDLLSYLPVVQGTNRALGAVAGILKGLVILWLLLYVLALCATSEAGRQILSYVEESPVLLYLYNHNLLLRFLQNNFS